jgi:hypothetical protein
LKKSEAQEAPKIISGHTSYDTSLQYLSLIIKFFQHKNVFTPQNTLPDNGLTFDPSVEKVIVDMVSMNAEQVNHLWATLGGKYLPSVLYKMRTITIEDDTPGILAEPIADIEINGHGINN